MKEEALPSNQQASDECRHEPIWVHLQRPSHVQSEDRFQYALYIHERLSL